MLNGKLSIERADNGWKLLWYEQLTPHAEVFVDATACVQRIAEVIGMQVGAGAARAFTDLVEGYSPAYTGPAPAPKPLEIEGDSTEYNPAYTGPAPAADPVLAEMLPPNAPPNALAGD